MSLAPAMMIRMMMMMKVAALPAGHFLSLRDSEASLSTCTITPPLPAR